ncbi:MAG: DUF6596 domain-containing protein [Alphaproteobacteria bacterium]
MLAPEPNAARRTAERTARESYGKLVAILAARTRDMASAEDALAEAFSLALQVWPERGIPERPEAWLITTARRALGHDRRHKAVVEASRATLDLMTSEVDDREQALIPDERLALMFVCAHPALDPAVQAPLMLQTVLGLDAVRIAECFLVSPAAMGQRLVRAKTKIREARIAFALPDADQLGPRLDAVLSAIYAAFGTGWEDVHGNDAKRAGLGDEAIWLARVLIGLCPDEPEAQGLLALMLYSEARRPARRDGEGRFVPLDQQDAELWSSDMIIEAETILTKAAGLGRPGRFQIEAAIQSVHVQRPITGETNWPALVGLYAFLARLSPTMGAAVAHAVALAEAGAPHDALARLDHLAKDAQSYQPYFAARARVMTLLGKIDEADEAFRHAAGLTADPAIRTHLLAQCRRPH